MIDIHFFAQLREQLDCAYIRIEYSGQRTIGDIKKNLSEQGQNWQALDSDNILMAVNQTLCEESQAIQDGDEIAFFPPVTGG